MPTLPSERPLPPSSSPSSESRWRADERLGTFETELLPALFDDGLIVADDRIVVDHYQDHGSSGRLAKPSLSLVPPMGGPRRTRLDGPASPGPMAGAPPAAPAPRRSVDPAGARAERRGATVRSAVRGASPPSAASSASCGDQVGLADTSIERGGLGSPTDTDAPFRGMGTRRSSRAWSETLPAPRGRRHLGIGFRRLIPMNAAHLEFCSSPEWRARSRSLVLPPLPCRGSGRRCHRGRSGTRFTTDVLRTRAERVTAVDLDLALAEDLATRLAGTNVDVVHGDATALDLPTGRFTGAGSFNMLHHVPTRAAQDQVFASLARVLRPGGACRCRRHPTRRGWTRSTRATPS